MDTFERGLCSSMDVKTALWWWWKDFTEREYTWVFEARNDTRFLLLPSEMIGMSSNKDSDIDMRLTSITWGTLLQESWSLTSFIAFIEGKKYYLGSDQYIWIQFHSIYFNDEMNLIPKKISHVMWGWRRCVRYPDNAFIGDPIALIIGRRVAWSSWIFGWLFYLVCWILLKLSLFTYLVPN